MALKVRRVLYLYLISKLGLDGSPCPPYNPTDTLPYKMYSEYNLV